MLLFLDPLLASLILVPSPFFPLCTPRDRAETSFHSACLTHAILVALLPDLGRFFVILKRNNRKKTGTSKNREKIKKRNLLKFKVYYLLKKSFQVFFLSFRYQVIFFFLTRAATALCLLFFSDSNIHHLHFFFLQKHP